MPMIENELAALAQEVNVEPMLYRLANGETVTAHRGCWCPEVLEVTRADVSPGEDCDICRRAFVPPLPTPQAQRMQYRVVYKRVGKRQRVVVVARRDTAEQFRDRLVDEPTWDDLPPIEYARLEERPVGSWLAVHDTRHEDHASSENAPDSASADSCERKGGTESPDTSG